MFIQPSYLSWLFVCASVLSKSCSFVHIQVNCRTSPSETPRHFLLLRLEYGFKNNTPNHCSLGFSFVCSQWSLLKNFWVFLDAWIHCLGPLSFAGWRGMLEARVSIPVFLQQCFRKSSVYVTPVKEKKGFWGERKKKSLGAEVGLTLRLWNQSRCPSPGFLDSEWWGWIPTGWLWRCPWGQIFVSLLSEVFMNFLSERKIPRKQ